MFDLTKVDYVKLRQEAERIALDIDDLEAAFEDIRWHIENSLSPTWEGNSKDVFFSKFKADYAMLEEHIKALRMLNNPLYEASKIYGASEESALELASGLNIQS